jgi:hypothetical protein
VVVVAVIKRAIICTAIVLAGAAPPVPQGRPHDGAGASVGPIRAAYHCEPVCAGARDPILLPPALPPLRSFGVEHYPAPVTVPEPGALALLGVGVAALIAARRRRA